MNPNMTVRDAIAQLEAEIQEKNTLLAALRAAVDNGTPSPVTRVFKLPRPPKRNHKKPAAAPISPGGSLKSMTVAAAATQVLKEAGRPMHGRRELLPALLHRGVKVDETTLPVAAKRSKNIERTAPGTYRYVES
jgi:hypothetical protein